ncbi:type VI secretion system Vgr family protein [Caballeronia ptereochthonis]|nr:type VI secretion system tip protein TssI/VgrG [Caballeronia ptereochthonis]
MPMSSAGEPLLQLRSVRGTEELSRVYEYVLELVTPAEPFVSEETAANIDLKKMIGKPLTLTIQLEGMGAHVPGAPDLEGVANVGAGEREISGLVFEARYLGQGGRQGRYEIRLKPWIELAARRKDYRIFQNRSVVEIVDEVLKSNYAYSYEKRLGETYLALEYQVQYGESDLDFVQRLMAEHGLYWFYEHSGGFHRMVIVDNVGAHEPVRSEAYRSLHFYPPGHRVDREYVDAFDISQSLQAGVWTTDDFDFRKPKATLLSQRQMPQQTALNDIENYEWPGDFTDPRQGEHLARIRIQELRARGERGAGSGNLRNVVCGSVFALEGYPQQRANRTYLVLKATLHAEEKGDVTDSGETAFRTTFEVQPGNVMFRPKREVEKPRTTGPQTAIVTGAPGSEIWTNQYGQIKVKFHWDRSPAKDHTSSCWVRVNYPWAGENYGGIHIPRVGTEVIVDFENGDPDRPIVIGRVYNAAAMPPLDLPVNATRSGFVSRTPLGSTANANMLLFEDKAGEEQVILHAERDYNLSVEKDQTSSVGANKVSTVGGDTTTVVNGSSTQIVNGASTMIVGGPLTMMAPMQTVAAGVQFMFTGSQTAFTGSQIAMTGSAIDTTGSVVTLTGSSTSVTGVSVAHVGHSVTF